MHCRLARLYLSGNDVLSLPDDTEILVNVCRIYTQLADSTSALYAMEKDRQDCRHAKYVNSYNCCKKVLDRMEEQNQAERMFIKITVKEANAGLTATCKVIVDDILPVWTIEVESVE